MFSANAPANSHAQLLMFNQCSCSNSMLMLFTEKSICCCEHTSNFAHRCNRLEKSQLKKKQTRENGTQYQFKVFYEVRIESKGALFTTAKKSQKSFGTIKISHICYLDLCVMPIFCKLAIFS